jgi:hypothetical protein
LEDTAAADWHGEFVSFMIALNEVMRSLGLADAYPFIITETVAAKIDFVHKAVLQFTNRPDGPVSAAD